MVASGLKKLLELMITLGTVNISKKTKEMMQEALEKGIIGQGKYIQEFEERLAKFFGIKHAIATANGTSADAAALAAVKYKDGGKKNEVIVPALTFIAQINAVYYNHLKPVFVDVDYDCQMNPEKIEEKVTKHTLAIMPTHLLGWPAKMEKILELAERHNLFVIEDSCEALGSRYRNKLCGTMGDMGCFSFYVSHSITTGEGGAVITNNDDFAEMVCSLRNHGRKGLNPGEHYLFPHIGFSGKMNTLEAIIGLGIMDELPRYAERRHQNMVKVDKLLGKSFFCDNEKDYVVPHGYPVLAKTKEIRDKWLIDLPEKYGIETRQIFHSIPTQSEAYQFLGEKIGGYPVAEDIGNRGLYLPCHQNLEEEDLIKISEVLKEMLKL